MKLLHKEKLNTRIISMIVAMAMCTIMISTQAAYAKTTSTKFGKPYGVAYDGADDYYIWHRVKEDTKPLYSYLSDGANDDLYANADPSKRKTFRVMLIHHYDTALSGCETVGGIRGNHHPFTGSYGYDTYLYYAADWTQLEYGGINHVGWSLYSTENDTQIRQGEDSFITRGAQYSFICDFDRQWKNGGGDHTNTLAGEYVNKYKYHFYYPDQNDVDPLLTLTYTKGDTYNNLYAFDQNGEAWGNSSSSANLTKDSNKRDYFKKDDRLCVDTWAVVHKGSQQMKILAYDKNGDDYCLSVSRRYAWFEVDNPDDEDENWIMFVGEPCTEEMLKSLSNPNSTELSAGSVRTINVPTFLRKEDQFTVKEGATLFVDSLLLINGTLINNGIIVVGPHGTILSWDTTKGTINCDNGDLIVRENAFVLVGNLIGKKQSTQIMGRLYAANMDFQNGIIKMYTGKGAMLGASDTFLDYKFVTVDPKSGKISIDNSKIMPIGSINKSELSIADDVKMEYVKAK